MKPKTFYPVQIDKLPGIDRVSGYRMKDGSIKKKFVNNNGRLTKDATNVWDYACDKAADAGNHPAVFPEKLAYDHILTWSNEHDIVYDPFLGSGTVAKMAVLTNRQYIGSEISSEYYDVALKRVQLAQEKIYADIQST